MVALQIRRVITGHDAAGKAVVTIDNVIENSHVGRPGATAYPVRSSEGFPVNNDWQEDEGLRKTGTTLLNGTIFRVLEFAPWTRTPQPPDRLHRLWGHSVGRDRYGA